MLRTVVVIVVMVVVPVIMIVVMIVVVVVFVDRDRLDAVFVRVDVRVGVAAPDAPTSGRRQPSAFLSDPSSVSSVKSTTRSSVPPVAISWNPPQSGQGSP